jgi:hypothetical protein
MTARVCLDDPTEVRAAGMAVAPGDVAGRVDYLDAATGQVLRHYSTTREPGGVPHVAGETGETRQESCYPACAEIYGVDTYQLVRAGLIGGKGVPEQPGLARGTRPETYSLSVRLS